ncbi:MAG: PKD domain-containing protein [Kiritimatiellae bacterium]|nr:PKD domain-containing protein [Kiritimatiellia bacterium]
MKKSGMTKVFKTTALAWVACGVLWAASTAQAVLPPQPWNGDMVGITTSPGITNTTLSNVGTPIPVILRLWGSFIITNTSAGPTALPRLRMNVSAESESWATLESLSDVVQFTDGVGPKTKVTFTYRVREGDMVDKLRIAGQDGTDVSGAPYEFDWSTYAIVRQNNIYSNAVWRFNSTFIEAPGVDPDHYDFSYRNVGIKTMQFGSTPSPVQVGEAVTWTVTTALPVSAGLTVNCYVWVSNSVPSGGDVTINGDKYKKLTIPAGESTASFDITGLTVGTNTVYLQGTMDYGNNATKGVQNFEARQIIVTPAPPPYVSALLPEAASPYDQQTLPESKSINTGTLKVRLSRTYPQEVWVRLDTELNGGPQSNLVFASSPYYVRVAPDTYESPLVSFSLPDGTLASALNKITITPVITNSAIAAFYNGETKGCVVSVVNAAPVITTPKSTDVFTATRDVPFRFTWAVDDVAVDMLSGMMVTWSFGDGTTNQVGNGSSGEIYHTFTDTAVPKTVTVRATDKDGLDSAEVQFTVNVVEPTPAPRLTLVFNSTNTPLKYAETREVNTGTLKVRLSQSYSAGDIDVLLSTLPQGNIQLALTNAMVMRGELESGEIPFTLVDGTVASGSYGVRITPVILTPAASNTYTDVRSSLVFVTNVAPVIATPPAADVLEEPANPYDKLVVGIPFGFVWQINDVDADASGLVLRWDFGDGTTLTETNSALEGTTYHAYTTTGKKTVSLTAIDKDGGRVTHLFPVRVLNRPTVRVLPPAANPVPEGGLDNAIAVELSEEFSSQFQVALTITPANSATAGAIALGTTLLTFPANTTYIEVPIDALDGTAASRSTGFTITPSITDTNSAAYSHFTMAGTTVKIANVAPVITITPVGGSIPQDVSYGFSLGSVVDVDADLPTMQVRWSFGDGTVFTQTGTTGSVFHTYGESGTYKVQAYATDKDGGRSVTVEIEVTVAPSKLVLVTPIGPNYEANYWGASGLGNGQVFSDGVLNTINRNNVYYFRYGPSVSSAALRAVPYKTDPVSGTYVVTNFNDAGIGAPGVSTDKDSFFYVWVGTDQGLPAQDLVSAQAGPTTAVTLPSAGGGTESVDIRVIQAIFSREWRKADNMGDINQDGIPDKIATRYNLPSLASGGTETTPAEGSPPVELINVGSFNKDKDAAGNEVGDFLPGAASGGSAIIGGISNVFATVGDPFTAILEVRGFHLGLNNETYNSDPDFGTGETDRSCERPTDPTLQDTDGDNFPDGWEYYFWYNAKVKGVTGLAYTPTNVAAGTLIPTKAILTAFDPLIPATDSETGAAVNRDLDNDGLSDIEELTIGTNPIQWDTDFDGICDGWEVLRGLNPNDQRDALNVAMNNPDGDYMARAEVPRQLVTLESGTQCLVPEDAVIVVGEALSLTEGVTGVYRYGGTNAPYAAGRPLTGLDAELVASVETVNALLLHNQVCQAFGFDPRTAWAATVNPLSNPQRFPAWVAGLTAENIITAPNTQPFTALDEYLLLKYMAELRLNGCDGSIGAGNAARKTADWTDFSTHPLTPDSDVAWGANGAVTKTDRMPDGWELYVSLPPGSTGAETVMEISPWDPYDGDWTFVGEDGLHNNREFHGTDCTPGYTNIALYGAGHQVVTITRPATDSDWVNKFWPSNPYAGDTDGDGLNDDAEMTFVYGSPVRDNGSTCTPGGGLNPCSMDTDSDQLPDAWERAFTYTGVPVEPQATTNGMNGTVSDWDKDWDRDGLANYQEYWVQAVRSFRYDFYEDEIPMDGSAGPSAFFTPVTNAWDFCQYPWGDANPPLWVMLSVGPSHLYVSTDPRDPDTDSDGMDDFYEMFHGLNPILGDTALIKGDRIREAYVDSGMYTIDYGSDALGNAWGAGLPMDFVSYPWLAGLDEADPDADGLRNLEEQLQSDTAAPSCSNTDPTPMWMTDTSSPDSLTARSYGFGGMFFWPGNNATVMPMYMQNYMMFSFEMNEGYDTDNDGLSDKSEMLQTATTQSDPRDHDDPQRRQAMWLSGTNSVLQSVKNYPNDPYSFRSFTIEFWARPEKVDREQVLFERPFIYGPSDLSTTGYVVRLNYRIGIAADGRVYVMYHNAGLHDTHTGKMIVYGRVLIPDEWVHIAARMDSEAQVLQLFLNNEPPVTVGTALIPANGIINSLTNPDSEQYPDPYYMSMVANGGSFVIGAANLNRDPKITFPSWSDYEWFYQGYIDEIRVWDGARSAEEIVADYAKRYTKAELMENRRAVAQRRFAGGSRVPGVSPQLPPELMYHYTFDNLFGADSAGSVAKVPRGYNYWEVTVNRPAGYEVGWWSQLSTHSTVYSDYAYMPWIENGVEHLPIFGGLVTEGTNVVLKDSNTVRDSVHWSHYAAGVYATPPSAHGLEKYEFPNSNDPYGYWYMTSLDILSAAGAGVRVVSDLLPLGGAWAKQAVEMWDNDSPAGVWADMADDLDADGLADWWERDVATNYFGSAVGWYDLSANGMTAGELYMRDLSKGYTEGNHPGAPGYNAGTLVKQTSDIDGDGLPDWWENLFNLKPTLNTGDNGAMGDPDRDGLSNYAEYLISEVYPFNRMSRPDKFRTSATQTTSDYFVKQGLLYYGQMFADHDFMEDAWEDNYHAQAVSRYLYDPLGDWDQDGWSNWAECRYGASALRSDPTLGMHLNPEGESVKDFPVPVIQTRLSYNGILPVGDLVLFAYSDPGMDGAPDAIWRVQTSSETAVDSIKHLGYWGAKTIRGVLSPGTIVPGSVVLEMVDSIDNPAHYVIDAGYDIGGATTVQGTFYGQTPDGINEAIGTINYITGEYEIDLSWFEGMTLTQIISPTFMFSARPEDSYMKIRYQSSQIMGWPKTLYLSDAETPTAAVPSRGYVKEGVNYFFALLDLNNNGMWDAGEPCGVPETFGVDIGYDFNKVNIELTDYTPGFLRMTLDPAQRTEDIFTGGAAAGGGSGTTVSGLEKRVVVKRVSVDGNKNYQQIMLDKTLSATRSFVHEGDFGGLGLDWGLTGVPTTMSRLVVAYEVYLGNSYGVPTNAVMTFTNTFDSARAKAQATYPVNRGYVYSARPTFKWTMPLNYTAFLIEVRRDSQTGPVIYNSGTVKAPARDIDGACVWTAPLCVGMTMPGAEAPYLSNKRYFWRVTALDAKYSNTTTGASWSDWQTYRLDVNAPLDSAGYGAVKAVVKYHGPATALLTGRVKVQAFHNAAFSGQPEAEITLAGGGLTALIDPANTATNANLFGLAPSAEAGDYYIRAFIDHNQNGVRDVWESWGYANYYGISDKPYDPRAVKVKYVPLAECETVEIIIEDADSDQDWFPDAWEYEQNPASANFLALSGPSTGSDDDPDYEINPGLTAATGIAPLSIVKALALGTTDADSDGVDDLTEMVLGSDPRAYSTAGDGMADGWKISLGLAPADTLLPDLTGLSLNDSGVTVQWKVAVSEASDVNRTLVSSYATTLGTASFEVLFTPSLQNPDWQVVATGYATLAEGTGGVSTTIERTQQALQAAPVQGFFRIRLTE